MLILESDIQARPVETLADVFQFLSIPEHAFSEEFVQQTVYPGTRRLVNDEGVFIADNDQHWRKVITTDWLQQLNRVFLDDVKELDRILGTTLVQSWEMDS